MPDAITMVISPMPAPSEMPFNAAFSSTTSRQTSSMSDAVETHDKWTFRRAIQSADPNWLLVETDED